MESASTPPIVCGIRVHVVDPAAYTPPYDHALCQALAATGCEVVLVTSHFAYGALSAPSGYRREELFYRHARGGAGSHARRLSKLVEHVPDMLRYRRVSRTAEVVHFQWLDVQQLDGHLLPPTPALVLSAHDVLPREPGPGQLRAQRRLYERFDAVVVHSQHGRRRLIEELGVDAGRVAVIAHGAFAHLAALAPVPAPIASDGPVVLCFGLMRPYKGLDVLLDAWRELGAVAPPDAQLWIVGRPRMDISRLREQAPASVRFVTRYVSEGELAGYFRRADLVVLPYREIDQSGVLFTALAFGKALLLSDVGGFPELQSTGAVRITPSGDVPALARALADLLAGPEELARMAAAARAAADGPYSWAEAARAHLQLYQRLLGD